MPLQKLQRVWPSACLAAVSIAVMSNMAGCERDDRLRGSGVAKTEQRDVGPFDRIRLEGGAVIEVTVGSSAAPLEITADDNILPVIETTVNDGELLIKPQKSIKPKTTITIKASTNRLVGVTCDGAGDVRIHDLSGDGTLTIDIHGAARIHATGSLASLKATAEGAGILNLGELTATDADVSLVGAGSATVHATNTLKASITGAGTILYLGNPKIEKHISGLGVIKQKS